MSESELFMEFKDSIEAIFNMLGY